MFLLSSSWHFHNSSKNLFIDSWSWSKVLREISCKVVRVEAAEKTTHSRKPIILKYGSKTEGSEEVPQELVFIHDVTSMERVPKPWTLPLHRSISLFRPNSHEVRWVVKEVIKEPIQVTLTLIWIVPCNLFLMSLLCPLLLLDHPPPFLVLCSLLPLFLLSLCHPESVVRDPINVMRISVIGVYSVSPNLWYLSRCESVLLVYPFLLFIYIYCLSEGLVN